MRNRVIGACAAVVLAGAVSTGCGKSSGASVEEGKAVFTKAGCGVCHTLSDAGSTGTVGPNLDDLKPSALKVKVFVTNGSGQMPSFKGQLSDDEIEAVAAYVQDATGAEPVEE